MSKSSPTPEQIMAGEAWDARYDIEDYRYGTRPNAFVEAEATRHIAKGARVLAAGDGEGRNGVWLAEQDFVVTSLDPSAVGMRKAAALAERRGVSLETRVAGLPAAELPDASFDAVVLTFVHVPPAIRPAVHADVVRLLAPGGVVLLQGYRPEHREQDLHGGPPLASMMFTEAMLREDFAALDIERLESGRDDLDEGQGHQGPSELVQMIARKPG